MSMRNLFQIKHFLMLCVIASSFLATHAYAAVTAIKTFGDWTVVMAGTDVCFLKETPSVTIIEGQDTHPAEVGKFAIVLYPNPEGYYDLSISGDKFFSNKAVIVVNKVSYVSPIDVTQAGSGAEYYTPHIPHEALEVLSEEGVIHILDMVGVQAMHIKGEGLADAITFIHTALKCNPNNSGKIVYYKDASIMRN
jgi:hypothetical protein